MTRPAARFLFPNLRQRNSGTSSSWASCARGASEDDPSRCRYLTWSGGKNLRRQRKGASLEAPQPIHKRTIRLLSAGGSFLMRHLPAGMVGDQIALHLVIIILRHDVLFHKVSLRLVGPAINHFLGGRVVQARRYQLLFGCRVDINLLCAGL